MLHLKTFGGLSVSVNDAPGEGAAQQRKTLALLALLAAAGRTGVSRDKLVAFLWPEADAEHARGLLKQACYALRRDLEQPELFLGAVQLQLNPAVITSDLQGFAAALERHDAAAAAALYTGPFLDGFYLSDAPEFERWVETEREQLKERAAAALAAVATGASARGDHAGAVEWWRRLAALDPLNSRVALGLMAALAAAGDRVGALQVAGLHSTLVREELGAAPDAAVAELTDRLRAEAERAPAPRRQVAPAPEPASFAEAPSRDEGRAEPGASGTQLARLVWKRRGIALVVGVVGLLSGGALLFRPSFHARSAETARLPKKLVVLPFANLGPSEEEYFTDGITEEITARLAAVGRLRIIGSTSANVYKGTKKPIVDIGRELGVDYVLEGSVRWEKAGNGSVRVRVTPQLVSTADGTHLWAEVYDEPLDEIFRVQSQIAQHVVQALDVTVLEPQPHAADTMPTRNLQAYDYYLRGNDYVRRGLQRASAQTAVLMYEKAVEADPGFALAYARLSWVHSRMYWSYWDFSEERLAKAKRAVDKALDLEPALPDAHLSLGVYYMARFDWDRALREFAFAEERRPNDQSVFLARAVLRTRQGRIREALNDFAEARQLDPASSEVVSNYGIAYDFGRDYPRAEALYDRAIALAPERAQPYLLKVWLYVRWDGTTQRARAVLDDAKTAGALDGPGVLYARALMEFYDRHYDRAIALLSSEAPEMILSDHFRVVPRAQLYAQTYGKMGRHDLERAYYDSARSVISRKAQETPGDPRLHTALGIAYAGLGRKREAIKEAEKALELVPISKEAYKGYHAAWEAARIYTMVGERNLAVDRLAYLLSVPGQLTPAQLRIDPVWDPLRGHAAFQRLLARGE